jgi:poly(beta-D-mannuronate) lyase
MKYYLLLFYFFTTIKQAASTDRIVADINEAIYWLNNSRSNDRIILKEGTYANAVIKFTNHNISFIAEHSGKVFFEGNSTLSFGGKNNLIEGFVWKNGGKDLGTKSVIEFRNEKYEAVYSTFKNCVITGYNTRDLNMDNKWVSVYGTYNTVINCLLKDKFNRGATLTVWLDGITEAHHTICYNYFLNRQNGPDVDNGLESIRIGDSKTSFTPAHCVVAFNRFEKCDGEIEIISNKSCHNSYLHNTFVNNDGGLTLRHGNDCLVDGNFFDGAEKEKSYGVRFIGEGHVAVNNYFYHLNGSPNNPFRSPVTIVNGLVNTPINGYFQVRRAVIADNIFVNNILPNIRVGAFSKRAGMTVQPDTILIEHNFMLDENGQSQEVYEELTKSLHLTIKNNQMLGQKLSNKINGFELLSYKGFKRDGFDWIKDGKGKFVASSESKAAITQNIGVGANWVEPTIIKEIKKRKYTILSAKEVGPTWLH